MGNNIYQDEADKRYAKFLKEKDSEGKINFHFLHSFDKSAGKLEKNLDIFVKQIKLEVFEKTNLNIQTTISDQRIKPFYASITNATIGYPKSGDRFPNDSATILFVLERSSSFNGILTDFDLAQKKSVIGHEFIHTVFKYVPELVMTMQESHNLENMGDAGGSILHGKGLLTLLQKYHSSKGSYKDSPLHPSITKRIEFMQDDQKNPYFIPATKMLGEIRKRAARGQISSLVNSLSDMRPEDFSNGRF